MSKINKSSNEDDGVSNDILLKSDSEISCTSALSVDSTLADSSDCDSIYQEITEQRRSGIGQSKSSENTCISKEENADEQSAVTNDAIPSGTERGNSVNNEFQEVAQSDTRSNIVNSGDDLGNENVSTNESSAAVIDNELPRVVVENVAGLDDRLETASEKLTSYYNNNLDQEHQECRNKFESLVDALNEVFTKLHSLLQASSLPCLDDEVAHRFHDVQQELVVLKDLVSQVQNLAERHGYSLGIKESLEEMALTLYCLRQMHHRQNILISEIVMTRRQNIELLKIIEVFRNNRSTTAVPSEADQPALESENTVLAPEPSDVPAPRTAASLESTDVVMTEGESGTALPEHYGGLEAGDPLEDNRITYNNNNNNNNSEVSTVASDGEMPCLAMRSRSLAASSWKIQLRGSLVTVMITVTVVAITLLLCVGHESFVNRFRYRCRCQACLICISWERTCGLLF